MARILSTHDNRPFAENLAEIREDVGHQVGVAARFPGLPMLVLTGHCDITPPVEHKGSFTKPCDTASLLAGLERLYQARVEAP